MPYSEDQCPKQYSRPSVPIRYGNRLLYADLRIASNYESIVAGA